MIKAFRFIGSVGCFDTFRGTPDTDFQRLNLIYAENGRGKTTLVAILRSLTEGRSVPITGRRRLGAQHDPRVVIDISDGTSRVFQNDAWSTVHDSLLIFDDHFVDDNVFSGLSIGADHRQNLHEVILGSQGVHLKRKVDSLTEQIAQLTREVREKQNAIPTETLKGIDLDTFCALSAPGDDDDGRRSEISRQLTALQHAEKVRSTRFFSRLQFPQVDLDAIQTLLRRKLDDLDATAVSRVQSHLAHLGSEAERWVADGVPRIFVPDGSEDEHCPFCGQTIDDVDLVNKYRAYFGQAYGELQSAIDNEHKRYNTSFGGDELARVQRVLAEITEQHAFWNNHVTIPEFGVDVEQVVEAWQVARDSVLGVLSAKHGSPLEQQEMPSEAVAAVERFTRIVSEVTLAIEGLVAMNDDITSMKESTEASDAADLNAELQRLDAAQSRHSAEISPLCEAYMTVRDAKKTAEREKRESREQLDSHRENVFPAYKTKVNFYLTRFGAGFRLGDVLAQDRGGRASTSYHLTIRDSTVPLVARGDDASQPCFKTALSAGDRNTLALSFFFASAELDSDLADKILVIDDPVTSLDDGRMTNTVAEVRKFSTTAKQLIVLSHAKSFLCRIHKHADPGNTSCLEVRRVADDASALAEWEPNEDQFTLYDQRHKLLRDFHAGTAPNIRQVAEALRPTMEGYLRVAFPEQCPPGTLLGVFRSRAKSHADNGTPIMDANRLQEVTEITEYANKFHHETNPAWEAENISDAELRHFSDRVLTFVSH